MSTSTATKGLPLTSLEIEAAEFLERIPPAARVDADRAVTLALMAITAMLDLRARLKELEPKPAPPPPPEPKAEPSPTAAKYISAKELAEIIGLTPQRVLYLARVGKIPCVRFGAQTVRFNIEDVWRAYKKGGR